MRYIVRNLTRRPVSILCNSGRSYHLPPKYAHELAGIEIENNALIRKLSGRKVLDVKPLEAEKGKSEGKKTAEASRTKPTRPAEGKTEK